MPGDVMSTAPGFGQGPVFSRADSGGRPPDLEGAAAGTEDIERAVGAASASRRRLGAAASRAPRRLPRRLRPHPGGPSAPSLLAAICLKPCPPRWKCAGMVTPLAAQKSTSQKSAHGNAPADALRAGGQTAATRYQTAWEPMAVLRALQSPGTPCSNGHIVPAMLAGNHPVVFNAHQLTRQPSAN